MPNVFYYGKRAFLWFCSSPRKENPVLPQTFSYLLPTAFRKLVSPLLPPFVGQPIALFGLLSAELENSMPLTSELLSSLTPQVSLLGVACG